MEDAAGDERGAIEAHPAVRQHAVAGRDEMRAEARDGFELREVGQFFVEDREVDVEAAAGDGRDALVESTLHINHGIDSVRFEDRPVLDHRRDVQRTVVIHLVQLREI